MAAKAKDRVIMGVDPGTNKMGYGIIRAKGNRLECVVMGYIDLSKMVGPYRKLAHIYERMSALVAEYDPDEVAFEAPFFGDNVQSMLKLGRAQGVAIAAAQHYGKNIAEYAPTKVKIAIAGNGRASKESVASMLKKILSLDEMPENLDATDGLAVALCHYFALSSPIKSSGSRSWSDFVKSNPDKVKI